MRSSDVVRSQLHLDLSIQAWRVLAISVLIAVNTVALNLNTLSRLQLTRRDPSLPDKRFHARVLTSLGARGPYSSR